MNPRVSRSSALASKATGFPIAKIAAKLAVGYTLDELEERHHQGDAGLVRADHRLCRHQDPALRLREIPRRRAAAHHLDEIGRRSDGHRPHLRGVAAEGAALDGDRPDRPRRDRTARRREHDPRRARPRRRPTVCASPRRRCGSASRSRKSRRSRNTIPGSSARSKPSSRPKTTIARERPAARTRTACAASRRWAFPTRGSPSSPARRKATCARCAPSSACTRSSSASTPARPSSRR